MGIAGRTPNRIVMELKLYVTWVTSTNSAWAVVDLPRPQGLRRPGSARRVTHDTPFPFNSIGVIFAHRLHCGGGGRTLSVRLLEGRRAAGKRRPDLRVHPAGRPERGCGRGAPAAVRRRSPLDDRGRDQGLFGPGLALFLTHFRRTRTEVGWRVASCAAVLSRVPRTEAPGRPRSSRRTTRRWTGRRAGAPTWGTGYCSVPGGATPELPGEAPAHRRYGPHRNLSEGAVGQVCPGACGPGGGEDRPPLGLAHG